MSVLDEVREQLRRPPAWGPNEQGQYMVDMTVDAYERDLDRLVEAARQEPDDECYEIRISAFGLTDEQTEALFDRVAIAAHALDEQVTCFGGPR